MPLITNATHHKCHSEMLLIINDTHQKCYSPYVPLTLHKCTVTQWSIFHVIGTFDHLDKVVVKLVNIIFAKVDQFYVVPRRYLGVILAPSSHCGEIPLAGKASWENNLSIATLPMMDMTNSTISRTQQK
jgi:hypothetical protein